MPWSGSSFRKHNSSLSAVQAGKAAKQANAILAKTGDEGLAIAVANKNAGKSHKMYKHKGFASGGLVESVHPSEWDWTDKLVSRRPMSKTIDPTMERRPSHAKTDEQMEKTSTPDFIQTPDREEDTRDGGKKGYAKGGKITQVAGKPMGKDDGLIAAQKGEYVIRKSAVKKLGTAVLDEVNKGHLPSDKLYSKHKAAA